MPGNPILMSGVERGEVYKAAALGEHTFEILKEVEDESKLHELFDPVFEKIEESQKAIYSKNK